VRKKKLGRFRPIGTTDSEHAYCYLLEALRSSFRDYPRRVRDVWELVADVGGELGADGTFNFLLGDGRHLYARCATRLCHIVRKAPFGLASLADEDVRIDFSTVTTPRDRVAVVATRPLTNNETWIEGRPGELWVFDGGRLRATLPSRRRLRAASTRSMSA
jgi:glutamine amidotransferase